METSNRTKTWSCTISYIVMFDHHRVFWVGVKLITKSFWFVGFLVTCTQWRVKMNFICMD